MNNGTTPCPRRPPAISKMYWLNEMIIDCCNAHLAREFPNISGLKEVSRVGRKLPGRCGRGDPVVQIINTDVTGPGSHWICLSTLDCDEDTIDVFDSAGGCAFKAETIKAICHLMPHQNRNHSKNSNLLTVTNRTTTYIVGYT